MFPYEPPIDIDRDAARNEAIAEAAKGRYSGPLPEWVQDAWKRFIDLLEAIIRILTAKPDPSEGGGGFSWGLLVVVLLALAALAFIVWKFGLPRWSRRVKDAHVETDESLEAADYRDLAERLADAGDFRAAVRERFRALVRELETTTIIERRPARTAYETAALATRELPDVAAQLHGAATLFNDVMYGDRHPARAEYEAMLAADEQVRASAALGPVSLREGGRP